MKAIGCAVLLAAFGCIPTGSNGDDSASGGSAADLTPYLGEWQVTGTVTTTCTDGTRGNLALSGPVTLERGTSSDLLRTVANGPCPDFPLTVKAANATLAGEVACPADAVSQVTVTSWQVTLGADESSATETGRAKTVFPPPETGTCTAIYSTTLVK
jgi:hypothetical protein